MRGGNDLARDVADGSDHADSIDKVHESFLRIFTDVEGRAARMVRMQQVQFEKKAHESMLAAMDRYIDHFEKAVLAKPLPEMREEDRVLYFTLGLQRSCPYLASMLEDRHVTRMAEAITIARTLAPGALFAPQLETSAGRDGMVPMDVNRVESGRFNGRGGAGTASTGETRKCYACGRTGHLKRNCFSRKKEGSLGYGGGKGSRFASSRAVLEGEDEAVKGDDYVSCGVVLAGENKKSLGFSGARSQQKLGRNRR
jgi:hypothetical protein